jgi:hypothetical protein
MKGFFLSICSSSSSISFTDYFMWRPAILSSRVFYSSTSGKKTVNMDVSLFALFYIRPILRDTSRNENNHSFLRECTPQNN